MQIVEGTFVQPSTNVVQLRVTAQSDLCYSFYSNGTILRLVDSSFIM